MSHNGISDVNHCPIFNPDLKHVGCSFSSAYYYYFIMYRYVWVVNNDVTVTKNVFNNCVLYWHISQSAKLPYTAVFKHL